jgi:O-antigen/teichoic acid export membrane protein
MVVSICFVEIWSGIMRYMFADNNKYKSIKAFLRLLPFMIVAYAFVIIILSHVVALKYPAAICIYGIAYLLFNVFNTICRGLERNIDYVISGLIYTIVSCGLSIFFSVYLHKGIETLFWSQVIGYLCTVVYVELRTHALFSAIKVKVDGPYLIKILKYSIPLMLNSFSFLFLGTYNKNLILSRLGESTSGQYAFVSKFSSIVSVLISIYSLAWQEEAFVNADTENRNDKYSFYVNSFFKLIGIGIIPFAFVSYIFAPFVGGTNYLSSGILIPFAVLSSYIADVSGMFSILIAVEEKTFQTLISTVLGAIVNVILVNLLIIPMGANGANISLCIGFGVASIVRFIFVEKAMHLKIELRWILYTVLGICAIYYFALLSKYALWIAGIISIVLWFLVNAKLIKGTCNTFINKIHGIQK